MHAKIVPIGTSRGIRIPKYLLDKYRFGNVVEIDDTGSGIFIQPVTKSRKGWDEEFMKVAGTKDDREISMPKSDWDEEEWEW